MNDKNFDKILHDQLANHGSRVPADMWSKIEKDLGRRKSRPILPFAFAALVLVGAVIYYSFNYFQENGNVTSQTEEANQLDHQVTTRNFNEEIRDNQLANSELNETTNESEIEDASTSSNDSELNTEIQTLKAQNNQSTIRTSQGKSNSKNQIGKSANQFYNEKLANGNLISTKDSDQVFDSNRSTTSNKTNASNSSTQAPADFQNTNNNSSKTQETNKGEKSIDTFIPIEKGASNQDINNSMSASDLENNSLAEDLADIAEMRKALLVDRLPLDTKGQSLSIGHFVYDPCSVKGGKKKNRVHCYSFVSQNTLVFADFVAGPQYSHKLLSRRNIQDPDPTKLLNNRKETESYMFSYNATARLGVKLPSGLTGTAGVSLDRYHERFDYYDPNYNRPTITHVIRDTIWYLDRNNMDSIVYVWEPISVQANGKRTVKHTNTLTFISIPLTTGYTWQMNKFNVGINGGVSVNLLFGKAGRITDPDGTVSSLNGSGSDDEFKAWAGIGLIGGLVFEYKMKNGLSFIAEPQFKYQLSNLATNDYGLEQRYVNGGINIGLRKILQETTSTKKKYGVN